MYGATLSIFITSCKTFHPNIHLYEKVMLPLLLVITLKFGKIFKAPRPLNISNFETNGTPKLQMTITFSKCKYMGQYVTPIFITHSKIFLSIYQSSNLTWFALPIALWVCLPHYTTYLGNCFLNIHDFAKVNLSKEEFNLGV